MKRRSESDAPLPPMACHRCGANYWDGCAKAHVHSAYDDCYAIDDIRLCDCGEYVHKHCAKDGLCKRRSARTAGPAAAQ